ncbi:MAG: helix-turn-helix domain-containing protein [Candidatus Hodarchaeaceae archaeon]|nr:helix-turn-helix domain-containing protein [Candidatus Hodarchaeaceae archaeon]
MKMRKIRGSEEAKPFKRDELREWMSRIERKIDVLISDVGKRPLLKKAEELTRVGEVLDIMTLLSLPDHLRKSAIAIVKLGKAMADDVAKETGRARAIESAYLNQLARMGYLKRQREGKRVYFVAEGDSMGVEQRPEPKGGGLA